MPIGKGQGKDDIGKIFVGGLAISTDSAGLQGYFEKYGEVTDCVLMTDPVTKRSRCFGFITFRDPSVVQNVMDDKPHQLDGKMIDPKPAVPRGPGQGPPQGGGAGRGPPQGQRGGNQNNEFKIFVGGLAHSTSKQDLEDYFTAYGKVVSVNLMVDPQTQKMRGFGFVTFESKDSVTKAADEHYHQINGKTVEAKRAETREPRSRQNQGGGGGAPGMMGGPQYGQFAGYGQQRPGMQGMGRGYGGDQGYGYAAPGGYQGYGGYGAPGMGAQANGAGYGAAPGYGAAGYGAPGREAQAAYGANAGYGMPGYPAAAAAPASTDYGLAAPGTAGGGAAAHAEAGGMGDYSAYGLGSYQQTDSQYGPTRGSVPADPYAGYPAAEAYPAAGAAAGGYGESFGRGGGVAGASRGFHPYGR